MAVFVLDRRFISVPLALSLLWSLVGCGSFRVTARYQSTGDFVTRLGQGRTVRLNVIDSRADPTLLGVTSDIYKTQIQWDRPAQAIVEDGFREALASAGYLMTDDARVVYQVAIREVTLNWARGIGTQIRASVSFDIAVVDAGGGVLNDLARMRATVSA